MEGREATHFSILNSSNAQKKWNIPFIITIYIFVFGNENTMFFFVFWFEPASVIHCFWLKPPIFLFTLSVCRVCWPQLSFPFSSAVSLYERIEWFALRLLSLFPILLFPLTPIRLIHIYRDVICAYY